jgi:aerobic C4-dicarboxylate transport protein
MAATIVTTPAAAPVSPAKPWYKVLYVQVLIAIVLGALVGSLWPTFATNDWIKALGDGFIKLIKMVIAPIIFAPWYPAYRISRMPRKSAASAQALVWFRDRLDLRKIGLDRRHVVKPGAGGALAYAGKVAGFAKQAEAQKTVDFFLHIIRTRWSALRDRRNLQVLLFSILFVCADEPWRARPHHPRFVDDAAMRCSASSPS